jgi:hypothetical protein
MTQRAIRDFFALTCLLGFAGTSCGQVCTVPFGDLNVPCTSLGSGTEPDGNIGLYDITIATIGVGFYNTYLGAQSFFQESYENNAHNASYKGSGNSSLGFIALNSNTDGNYNTAIGMAALNLNTSGDANTAVGPYALYANKEGSDNAAIGLQALYSNTDGINNTAIGYQALYANTSGYGNSGQGSYALLNNTTGNRNIAIGNHALGYVTTGGYNIGIGYEAGQSLKTGSNNIDIANPGETADGETSNSGVIRIGTQSPTALQTQTFIAGIYDNAAVSGLAVVIDSNGQLGTVSSSARFKAGVESVAADSEKLQRLRPVRFHYKADPKVTLRYGLIAEEVANVYPELVVRDENGRIDGVRYDELAPLLLAEVQRQAAEIRGLKQQQEQFATQAQMNDLRRQLQAALAALQARDQLVARR